MIATVIARVKSRYFWYLSNFIDFWQILKLLANLNVFLKIGGNFIIYGILY